MGRTTRLLAEGIYFGEGPRWHDGRLWFSDFYAHAVKSVSLAGDLRTEFEIDDQPSGLGWMPDGSMLVVSMKKRQVLKRSPDGSISRHADLSQIADFHCNDMVVDAHGRAYVGNFGFDLDAALTSRGTEAVIAEHPTARLALIEPNGAVRMVSDDMHFPNGTVITPDGATLIIGETLAGRLTAFDIGAEGDLSDRRVWASTWPRVPDGIALDAEGRVWLANPIAPECVLFAEGGEVVEVIDTGQPCYACMLGGEDGRTLFMLTAKTSIGHEAAQAPTGKLLVAEVDAPRAGWP
ncbi:SMP-30/gluconolactonase/LRE family protein [Phenylobacterium montanum]|uniref:SMP-30/gluconolactonase/LRE family protein n=1 Tax=Phenylobacterium montanum TaxID=2823693 RepID=A0A975G2N9_9CAUL|nr:SMP-30/gluconolactonase/LRE family protein [Caulobacter sp. S6]QUD89437.1 SMP-30/gluconolactonase/LRE family protein [Caulobacter sp. S6]